MIKKLLYTLGVILLPLSIWGNYYGSQVNYRYSESNNRMYVTVKYWRLCNDWPDRLVDVVNVEAPGCGTFTIPMVTKIRDVSLFKERYPSQACILPNGNNQVRGLEEFMGEGSFALDTLPFKNLVKNGCCRVYLIANFFFRPPGMTTGVTGQIYNYALIDLCALKRCKLTELKSPDYLQPMYTEKLYCNQPVFIDFGAYGNGKDSIDYILSAALGNSRTNTIPPSSPLTTQSPMSVYCGFGNTPPCKPNILAKPPIGFHIDPKTSAITFTPTKCKEQGVAVIQANQFMSDTNGRKILTGLNRREFTMIVEYGPGNNTPSALGPYEYSIFEGDTIDVEIKSKDDLVVVPPPGVIQTDSTYFTLKSSSDHIEFSIKDTFQRERTAQFKFAADSSHLCQSPIVISVVVYDQDSLVPSRSLRSYRVYIMDKLNVRVSAETLSCGTVKFTLVIDSLDYLKYQKEATRSLIISKGNWLKTVRLDTSVIIDGLPEKGIYNIHLLGGDQKTFGYDFSDTFSYFNNLISIKPPSRKLAYCGTDPSLDFKPEVINQTSDSVEYEWFLGSSGNIFSRDSILQLDAYWPIIKSYTFLTLKVRAGACGNQVLIYFDSFDQGKRFNQRVAICEPTCDTINLLDYRKAMSDVDSVYVQQWFGADSNLSSAKYASCNVFRGDTDLKAFTLLQRHSENHCIYRDTVQLDFINQKVRLADQEICKNSGAFDLATLSDEDSLFRRVKGQLWVTRNGTSQNGLVSIDQSNPNSWSYSFSTQGVDTGIYKVYYSYQDQICLMQDSCELKVRPLPESIVLKQSTDKVCFQSGLYNLKRFLESDSGFAITHINNQIFSSDPSLYIHDTLFDTDVIPGTFKMDHVQMGLYGCRNTQKIILDVLPLPQFDLGSDIQANSFTTISLFAPVGMQSYTWNLKNHAQRVFQFKGGELDFDSGVNEIICKVADQNGCEFSDTLIVNYSTHVKGLTTPPFKIFPNPSTGNFEIRGKLNIVQIEVFNSIGKKVAVENQIKGSDRVHVNLGIKTPGEYYARIKTEYGMYSVKLIVLAP